MRIIAGKHKGLKLETIEVVKRNGKKVKFGKFNSVNYNV